MMQSPRGTVRMSDKELKRAKIELQEVNELIQEIGDLSMIIRTSGSCGEHIKRLYQSRDMKAELNRKMEALEDLIEHDA